MSIGSPARLIAAAVALAAMTSASAAAQDAPGEPIGRFSADVRMALPRYPEDGGTAGALTVTTDNLPSRGLGVAAAVNVYPFRLGKVAIGFGGEWLTSRGSKTLEPTTAGGTSSPTVKTSFSALAPQVSLNFGGRDGWSYVSGGIGFVSFTTEREDARVADADGRTKSLHYGGGARWFAKEHLAFCFDLRFYKI